MEPFSMDPISAEVLTTIANEASREAFAAHTVPNSTTDTFCKSYKTPVNSMIEAAIHSAMKAMAKLFQDREKLLIDRINEVQVKISSKPSSFSEMVGGGRPPREQRQVIASQVLSQVKQIEQRALNVVVIGMKESETTDFDMVNKFFTEAGVEDGSIRNVRRLKKGNNTITSNLILVSLTTQEARTAVLDKCRHHKQTGEFQHVFAREDRTPAEQYEFNKTREETRRRNTGLQEVGLLNKPFRYIIHRRTGKVDLIDVVESEKERRYVFRKSSDIDAAKAANTRPTNNNSNVSTGGASGNGGNSAGSG
jgi:hypothetical protein